MSPATLYAKTRKQIQDVLAELPNHRSVAETLRVLDIEEKNFYKVMSRHPDQHERIKLAQAENKARWERRDLEGKTLDLNRQVPPKGSFVDWRWRYLGRPTPDHMLPAVEAMEDRTNNVVLIYMPPGAGKDTTAGDYILYRKCDDRGRLRVAWVMESEPFAVRRLGRLASYLTDPSVYDVAPDGPGTQVPTGNLLDDYGPFRWHKDLKLPDGRRPEQGKWNAHQLEFVTAQTAPEADPDIWATGVTGAMYGARIGLAVLSDIFTKENQRNPALQAEQLEWLDGTFMTRFDSRGQRIFIMTRVGPTDNQGKLLDRFTDGIAVIHEAGHYRKYANGVATVIVPAIEYNEDGTEYSYWESKFPLRDRLILDGTTYLTDELEDEEYMALARRGAERVEGLNTIRRIDSDMFNTMYQQNPPDTEGGTFTDLLLDHCDDPSRTVGVYRVGETLVLGVDPAKAGGAAWVLWGWDAEAGTATVIDMFFGTRLGIHGIINKLLIEPIRRYMPRDVAYEVNRYETALVQPEVQGILRDSGVNLIEHRTGANRTTGEDSLPMMALYMQRGVIRFPAATADDQQKMAVLKQHFKNFDTAEIGKRSKSGQGKHAPDDAAFAAWVGWLPVKGYMERQRKPLPSARHVPQSVAKRFGPAPTREPAPPVRPVTDLVALYHGSADAAVQR